MRLKSEIKIFIKDLASRLFPDSDIYLFGSRVDDNKKGGDIDILLISDRKIDRKKIREFKIIFYKEFGWQKIDLVNFTRNEESNFKRLILKNAQAIDT